MLGHGSKGYGREVNLKIYSEIGQVKVTYNQLSKRNSLKKWTRVLSFLPIIIFINIFYKTAVEIILNTNFFIQKV